jgi:hypothetical protein
MYQDLGDGDIVFGGKMTVAPYMACQQSLFLIPNRSLLKIVSHYLNMPPDKDMLPEDKFVALKQTCNVKELSFGSDRMRPIPWDDQVFYFQQATEAELKEAKKRGFI